MKKISLFILAIGLILIFSITYFNFKAYNDTYNNKMLGIVNEILQNNPEINIENIVTILNDSHDIQTNKLEEYGYNSDTLFFVGEIKQDYTIVIISNVIVMSLFLVAIITLYNKFSRKKTQEIYELINYLDQINKGDYDIKLEKYNEDEISKLRDQIYKTTIILKENEKFLLNDKIILKNNLADISHQLKTPLTAIMLMLENITEDKEMPPSKRNEYILKISEQTDKMKYLIEVLLKLSRLDASVIEFKKDKIKCSVLIESVVANMEYLLSKKNITINLNIENDNIIVCDKKWQEEALTNILKNSIENSFQDGKIDINLSGNNFYSAIKIKDYGIGISQEMQKRIFDRFKKSDNSNGIGIGLNLAKTIIEKDDGMISLKSEVDKFTQFEIKYVKKL